ncbi:MAG: C69 family dipeptidase [Eubacteriales bacterium]|nr:C69 family dipeptidase [Eubacteriales bacterium]
MLSCDTFALGKDFFKGGQNVLAKNSDRPVGEAQPLYFEKGGDHGAGEMLKCTHLTIPQAEHTYSVLGSKPYWIWGFEMGANEKGLYIGNEAQGSRNAAESEEGMLGMDMLRLALERAATAREAIDVIAGLLKTYGQNANANVRYDRRYENSYMIVDHEEIWVMETAGREWAARKAGKYAAISNCYTIEDDYDLCSENMEQLAREKKWISSAEKMNFAKAYTLPAARQSHSVPRCRRMNKLISGFEIKPGFEEVYRVFRDHFEGELIEPRYGAGYANFISICMHAQDSMSAQTAASMIFTYDDVLGKVFRYAPSVPCCSVYIPVYWTESVPEILSSGRRYYDEESLWWSVEKLAMAVSIDEDQFGDAVRKELRKLEKEIADATEKTEEEARKLIASGDRKAAMEILNKLTEESAVKLRDKAKELFVPIGEALRKEGGIYGQRKDFLEEYCEWARMSFI